MAACSRRQITIVQLSCTQSNNASGHRRLPDSHHALSRAPPRSAAAAAAMGDLVPLSSNSGQLAVPDRAAQLADYEKRLKEVRAPARRCCCTRGPPAASGRRGGAAHAQRLCAAARTRSGQAAVQLPHTSCAAARQQQRPAPRPLQKRGAPPARRCAVDVSCRPRLPPSERPFERSQLISKPPPGPSARGEAD